MKRTFENIEFDFYDVSDDEDEIYQSSKKIVLDYTDYKNRFIRLGQRYGLDFSKNFKDDRSEQRHCVENISDQYTNDVYHGMAKSTYSDIYIPFTLRVNFIFIQLCVLTTLKNRKLRATIQGKIEEFSTAQEWRFLKHLDINDYTEIGWNVLEIAENMNMKEPPAIPKQYKWSHLNLKNPVMSDDSDDDFSD